MFCDIRSLPNVTYCTLICQSSGNWGRHAKQHAFIYQLWTTRALLNVFLDSPNYDSQNSSDETHELGLWTKNEKMCYELEPWVLTSFFLCKYGLFWALKAIFPKFIIMLMWCGLPMKWNHMVWKTYPQHLQATVTYFKSTKNLKFIKKKKKKNQFKPMKCLQFFRVPLKTSKEKS